VTGGQGVTVFVFRAAPRERNGLEVVLDGDTLRVSDSVPLSPGPGCTATGDPNTVRCRMAAYTLALGADVELGDGVDSALLDRALSVGNVVRGGSGTDDIHASGLLLGEGGDDILSGGSGRDRLRGASGDDQLFGGPGRDALLPGPGRDIAQSGAGDDRIAARDGAFDRISCGGGRDTVTLDRLDFPGESCFGSRLRRSGAPRALPLEGILGVNNRLRLEVACPSDSRRACRGTVVAKLGKATIGRRRFRVARGTHGASAIRPSRRALRKIRRSTREGLYTGRFTMTVRSRGRTVNQRVPLSVEGR
jgi:hemolysin type calcium-binding protein